MGHEKIETNKLSTAQRAMLKRCTGKSLAQAGRALGAFYAVKPPSVLPWQEERFFAVLCMTCLWGEDDRGAVLPMENCLRRIRKTDSLDHRVLALMDTDWADEDGLLNTKVSRLARQIRSSEERVSPDFVQLYQDLLYWNSDSRAVQKRWARAYFGNRGNNDTNETENNKQEGK